MRCNRSSAGRSRGPANLRYWAGSQAMSISLFGRMSGRIEGGYADPGAPAMRLDAGSLEPVAELPADQAAAGQSGAGPRIERRPRHERAAPAISPDLDPHRSPSAGSARVKAKGVGDDQRVGRH